MDTKESKLPEYISKEKFNIKWEEVVGQEKVKETLKELIIDPVKSPKQLDNKQKPLKGILLYGPPGVGKTYLAKAIANEFKGKFFTVYGPTIVSQWNVQTNPERIIKDLFDYAKKNKPSIICLDEIDFITKTNNDNENMNDTTRKLKQEFLKQMHELDNEDGIVVLGTAAYPWELDSTVRKCFQKKIYITLPELNARKILLELNLKNTYNNITNEQIEYIAKNTEFFSCSDIIRLIQDVIYESTKKCFKAEYFKKIKGINGLEWNYTPCEQNEPEAIKMKIEDITDKNSILPPKINFEDFEKGIHTVKPSLNIKDLKNYEKFIEELSQEE